MRRALLVLAMLALAPRPAEACVQHPETNKLLGWAEDGSAALAVRVDPQGKVLHAELLPTRYEGWKYLFRDWHRTRVKPCARMLQRR